MLKHVQHDGRAPIAFPPVRAYVPHRSARWTSEEAPAGARRISVPIPGANDYSDDGLDHKREPLGIEKVADEQLDTQRREDFEVTDSHFSDANRVTIDGCDSLYSFM